MPNPVDNDHDHDNMQQQQMPKPYPTISRNRFLYPEPDALQSGRRLGLQPE